MKQGTICTHIADIFIHCSKAQCLQSLTPKRVKPGANPIPLFAAMIEDIRNMRANGSDVEDEVVCLLFLRALPDEYVVFRQMLEREREKLTIDRLRAELRARHDLWKEGKSLKTSDTAFPVDSIIAIPLSATP